MSNLACGPDVGVWPASVYQTADLPVTEAILVMEELARAVRSFNHCLHVGV
jgi:hypothetical protein